MIIWNVDLQQFCDPRSTNLLRLRLLLEIALVDTNVGVACVNYILFSKVLSEFG